MPNSDDRVIVVGAGPVGAIMTLALVTKGIPVTLIEAEADAVEDQRAATVHPPTVEMLAKLGLKDVAFSEEPRGGLQSPIFHFRDRVTGELIAVFDIGVLNGEVPFPFVLQWEQYKLVRAALPLIEASGIGEIRFSTRLTGLEQGADTVSLTVDNQDGEVETLRARYVIGADGARSFVRQSAGIEFEGFTWPERFIKIGTTFDFLSTERSYGGAGIWRGIFPVPADEPREKAMSVDGVQRRLQGIFSKPGDYDIAYHAIYDVHQRVAATFNKGRVLLAGDSAHVNNPIGGMGMNGGIHDAMNLAEKLSDVLLKGTEVNVLDRYSRQRRKAQIDFVQSQSIQNKKALEEKDPATRRKNLDNLRRASEDLTLHKQFLMRSSLFDSLRSANAVE
jgi:3-(3-hydroxy-phenyl)propionate hydroxylase